MVYVGAVPGGREEAGHGRVKVQPDSLCTELRSAATSDAGVQEHCPQGLGSVDPQRDVWRSGTWNAHHWLVELSAENARTLLLLLSYARSHILSAS